MGGKLTDLTGRRFGRLTVITWDHYEYQGANKRHYWKCLCDCGNTKVVKAENLYRGSTQSCGCLRKKSYEYRQHLYDVLRMAKKRCTDQDYKFYKNYGARGIRVCDEWTGKNGVDNFVRWAMSSGYHPGLTLERIDNDGNYSPDNCRWATMKEQSNNRRSNITITMNGETKTLTQWCEHFSVPYDLARDRYVGRGWTIEDAMFTPKFHKPLSGREYGKKSNCAV